jgi:ribosome-interacting GTPase 1
VIYALNNANVFNPFDIDENVTVDNIIEKIKNEEYLSALVVK